MADEKGQRRRPQARYTRAGSRPVPKNTKKKSGSKLKIILVLAVFVFAGYTVFSMVSLQADLSQARTQLNERKTAIEQKSAENDQLKKLIEHGSEKEIVECMAREKLGYVYAGEEIFKKIQEN